MHTVYLILKYHPHLELEWLCTTVGLAVMAALTLDLTTILLALIALISTAMTSYFTYLMSKAKQAIGETNVKVDDYHKSVNSKMDKLLEVVKASALAEGHLAGVEAEKQRRALQDAERAKGGQIEIEKEKNKPKEP